MNCSSSTADSLLPTTNSHKLEQLLKVARTAFTVFRDLFAYKSYADILLQVISVFLGVLKSDVLKHLRNNQEGFL